MHLDKQQGEQYKNAIVTALSLHEPQDLLRIALVSNTFYKWYYARRGRA